MVERGHIPVPKRPGLGVNLNEEVARSNPYTGDHLHLEMEATPYDYAQENWFTGG